jgi:tripeptide aminopeptidase
MVNEISLTDRFLRYVSTSSESSREAGFAAMLAAELQTLGCVRIKFDDAGIKTGGDTGNLYAVLEGATNRAPLLLVAHLDTVSPGTGIQPIIKDGIIRSSGNTVLGADDKSGIAAIMEALSAAAGLSSDKRRTVEILFTVSEEAGLLGSANASFDDTTAKAAVVFDSSEPFGAIVNEGPWAARLDIGLTGKSAHAAIRPKEGIHALRIGVEIVSTLRIGKLHPNLVVNVANFIAPGQGNIIPDKASFEVEIRSFGKDILESHITEISASMTAHAKAAGAGIQIERRTLLPGFLVPEDSTLIAELESSLRSVGAESRLVRTFGGSDAANLNNSRNGSDGEIQAVNISTGMKKSHGLDEYIAIDDLVRCAGVALHLITSGEIQ